MKPALAVFVLGIIIFAGTILAESGASMLRTPVVIAAAGADGVRVAASDRVAQIRIAVVSSSGSLVFDSGWRDGNVLDWSGADQFENALALGAYRMTVSARDLAGEVTERQASVTIDGEGVRMDPSPDTLTPRITMVVHDGRTGQIVNTSGDLAFRFGDFLMRKDTELMRLTADGRLGIGTAAPQAKLDVNGLIRTSEGIVFADGTVQHSATTATSTHQPAIATAGTGTVNQIPKWTDTAGTLADSAVSETGGKVVVGSTNVSGQIQVIGAATADVFSGMGADIKNGPAMNYGYAGSSFGRGAGFFNVRPDALAMAPNPSLRFETLNVQRMIITNAGNVGIGTIAPAEKLEVAGNLKISGVGSALQFADGSLQSTAATTGATGTAGGDLSGTYPDPAVASVGGQSAANVASGAALANAAADANTPSAIVKRDGSGNFSAGTITAALAGNATTATSATSFTGTLGGEVTGAQGATVVSNAVSANTNGAIVRRDGSGNFSAGTVTLAGNLTFPASPSTLSTGVIAMADQSFLHNYGVNNTFLGISAGDFTMTGDDNSAIGFRALEHNTSGCCNLASGSGSLQSNTSGFGNTASGSGSLFSNTTGNFNIALGVSAGSNLTTSSNNIDIGNTGVAGEGATIRIGTGGTQTHTFIAGISGATTAAPGVPVLVDVNGQLGTNGGSAPTSSNTPNSIVLRDGSGNFSAGTITATLNGNATSATTATTATNFSGSLGGEVTGTQAATIVSNAVSANTFNAIVRRDNAGNFSAGTVSLAHNLALPATSAGGTSGVITLNSNSFAHAFGSGNTFLGSSAGNFTMTGNLNTGLGTNALQANTSGAGNVAVGFGAGSSLTNGNNNIDIGNSGAAGDDNMIKIGVAQGHTFVAGIHGVTPGGSAIAVFIDANGQLGTTSSSRRYKFDIASMGDASADLMRLRPVTFRYLAHGDSAPLQYGLIAEEVAEVYPELVARNKDGEVETVLYQFLAPMLLNEVQKQHATIERQELQLDEMLRENESLRARLERIEKLLAR